MVGRARGRSTTASTTRLPGNWSRTSTHATAVPTTQFSTATPAALAKVSSIAASDSGWRTAEKKALEPPSKAFAATAARGNSTRTDA